MSSDGKPRCNEESVEILSLPVELLVYIISFLPIRDKVKLRNVSWRLRVVGETPSLWRQFLWPLYDRREEHSVMSVLKDCGEYIKQLVFPDHVIASTLIKMLSFCDNVTELSLPPPGTKLDPKQLGIALQSMGKLETLEVQLSSDIKPLLQIGEVESHIQLWDMLNDMKKLTYLALDVCLFGISIPNEMRYMDNFFSLVWQFSNLQGIEIRYSFGLCVACFECKPQLKWVWLFLSYFPSLQHCKFCTDDSDSMQDIINGCKELTHLSCQCVGQLSLSSACNSNLQQLSVLSDNTDIPDIFLETVSAHCGLVHVAISVNSVSTKGITSLIRNSPELLTMVVFTHQSICNKRGSKVNLKKFKNRIKETFPCRKLYSVGTFKIVQNNKLILHHFGDYLLNSVLSSLWT
ncbi:uncharacterized protein [Dysidea avara]|uniref:uncharacterized protein n=1 Tax=Dysidea avara TaxID=196820 RepID=UPI00333480F2